MYVAADKYEQAAAVIRCNLELGAFLRIVPLLAEKTPSEDATYSAFKNNLSMHKILQKRNYKLPV